MVELLAYLAANSFSNYIASAAGTTSCGPSAWTSTASHGNESHATALDRNELGALLVAAGLGSAQEHALISLLTLNGPRVSEALGADITAMRSERGHRTLTVLRKGGKIVTIPLAPPTSEKS